MRKQGLFGIQKPEDMLEKAHRDYSRLRANPMDEGAAFDFFVTARHIPDWLEAAGRGTAKEAFDAHVALRIARNIADGGKHFEATAKQHQQVEGTSVSFAAWAKGAWAPGSWAPGTWAEDELLVLLSPKDPDTAVYGERIEVGRLAEEVLRALEQVVQEHAPAIGGP